MRHKMDIISSTVESLLPSIEFDITRRLFLGGFSELLLLFRHGRCSHRSRPQKTPLSPRRESSGQRCKITNIAPGRNSSWCSRPIHRVSGFQCIITQVSLTTIFSKVSLNPSMLGNLCGALMRGTVIRTRRTIRISSSGTQIKPPR